MIWDPPSRLVAATRRQRPYLTWQMFIQEAGGYQIHLNDAVVHQRTGVVAGLVHTASHFLDGNALDRRSVIQFKALHGIQIRMEAVTKHFQQRR